MKQEHFNTILEFRNKYPAGLYVCSNCRTMTPSSTYCPNCKWSANGLFRTMGNGYIYSIANEKPIEIFQPIELFEAEKKGKSNEGSD